jgi:signal transduction histidine kinase/PAS domain-containing protein
MTEAVLHSPPALQARDGPRTFTRSLMLGFAAAAIGATAAAVFVISTSRYSPNPVGHAVLSVVLCLSFVGAGLLGVRSPPFLRFGLLLVGVGFSSLFGALYDANGAVPYTIGVFTANIVFATLVHSLLAFPHGRLGTRTNRALALAAYVDVLAFQAVAILFDPLTRWHTEHPHNAALVASRPELATALEELEAGLGAAIALAVAVVLTRRARAATPVLRRQLVPVLAGGKVALLLFSIAFVLAPLSSEAAVAGIGLGLLPALALPGAFVGLLLQGRLSRAAVGELLVELREPGDAPDLRDALRRALGDPSLELARMRPEDGAYVGRFGESLELPVPGGTQVTSPIVYHGEPVGMLVHDRSLRLRPELLDAVTAAAGFALANERALESVQQVELRNRALLDAIPDPMIRVTRDGTYLDVRADDRTQLLNAPEDLIGRNVRDALPKALADPILDCVESTLDSGTMKTIDYEIEIDGLLRFKESRMVPSGPDEVVTIVRDFTDQRRTALEQRRLAEEQAALRRVATLVAGDGAPETVFQTVTEEVCALLEIRSAVMLRYEDDETATIVGKFGPPRDEFVIGGLLRLDEGAARNVRRTGRSVQVDYAQLGGPLGAKMRELGFRASVGVPINVAGACWGALITAFLEGDEFPPETESRLQQFAELVGLAVASAHAREELAASRLRIVEASDAARRRIERNLHDGAQQRLVALSVGLRLAQAKVAAAPHEAHTLLDTLRTELAEALTELRELAQGIHPAVLTERGLPAALEVLASRTPVPVELDVQLTAPLPAPVEAAAYYVVSEALANVVKHAHATAATVCVGRVNGSARVEVRDNGVGGARPDGGSGLWGLRDRVETLAGTLEIASRRGNGTRVVAEIPV